MRLTLLFLLLLPACALSLTRPGTRIAPHDKPSPSREASPDGNVLPPFAACAPLVLTNPKPARAQAAPVPPDPRRGDTTLTAVRNRALCGVVRGSGS